jgi:WbqC-like protein family
MRTAVRNSVGSIQKSVIMSKTIVILQSNYIPWRGYFDLIRQADIFIFLDVVQFTKNDWRNRNRIKTPTGPQWLTIPVRHKLSTMTAIDETLVADPRWSDKHIKTLTQNYSRAGAFAQEAPWLFEQLSSLAHEELLSKINQSLLSAVSARIGIKTTLAQCTDFAPRDNLVAMEPSARLLALCKAAGATRYLSGPAARNYLDVEMFADAGIEVAWMNYESYPSYPQLWEEFDGKLSIVDLLLNAGQNSASNFPQL